MAKISEKILKEKLYKDSLWSELQASQDRLEGFEKQLSEIVGMRFCLFRGRS